MTKFSLLTGLVLSIILLAMLSPGKSPVIESAYANEEGNDDRITVVAPRITRERARRGSGSLLQVESVEQTAVVDFTDLDLGRTADMFVLEDRIREAAAQICEELAQRYPQGQPATSVCVQRAVDDAMADARLIARGQ
jgi:UrcA family protein